MLDRKYKSIWLLFASICFLLFLGVVSPDSGNHNKGFSFTITGGMETNDNQFIQPFKLILDENDIPLIQTQNEIDNFFDLDGWIDYIHLNLKGAKQFTNRIVDKLDKMSQ